MELYQRELFCKIKMSEGAYLVFTPYYHKRSGCYNIGYLSLLISECSPYSSTLRFHRVFQEERLS